MKTKLAQQIYDRVMGYEEQPLPDFFVENLFADGTVCDELYGQIYDSKLRIYERLGVDEDPDMELILDSLDRITRLVAQEMFHHGTRIAAQQ